MQLFTRAYSVIWVAIHFGIRAPFESKTSCFDPELSKYSGKNMLPVLQAKALKQSKATSKYKLLIK